MHLHSKFNFIWISLYCNGEALNSTIKEAISEEKIITNLHLHLHYLKNDINTLHYRFDFI